MENIYKKIKKVEELKEIVADLKKRNKKVVHCHGVFDLVHPGHIRHLAAAKKEGDILIVSLTADRFVKRGPGRPIFNEELRAESLAAIETVDFVCIDHNPTAVDIIQKVRPDVFVKGQDYEIKDKDITGKIYEEEEAIKSVGGRLAFTYDITFSSSKLINEYLDVFSPAVREYLKEIAGKYSIDQISGSLKAMKKLRALVIGDAIIDQYFYCESLGRSLKGHIVVTKYLSEESFAGGVFATANNVAELCGEVDLVSILGGQDSFAPFIRQHLAPNVNPRFFLRPDAPTTIKRRFVDPGPDRKMFQICYMNDDQIPLELEEKIISELKRVIPQYDLVVVSDFGHGFISNRLVKLICDLSKSLALNVQTNSANTGFNLVTKYPRADYVSVDEPEIRLAAHQKNLELKAVMEMMLKTCAFKKLMVTRGAKGSVFYSNDSGFHEAPAVASKVVDAIGAGDAFFAYTAPCAAIGMEPDLMSFIGNAVGALAVQIVCNREPVNLVDLMKFITRLLK